jgi:spore coat polysaccharide biosynthesis protein SpsF
VGEPAFDPAIPPVAVLVRLSSKRLPGKALLPFGRDVLISSVLDGVSRAIHPSGTIIVTSDHKSDDRLAGWCKERDLPVMRGSLHNVADRLLQCADALNAPALVRVSGDSPFIDPALIDHAVNLWMRGPADLVTNTFPRSFPKGQSVEVISTEALRRLLRRQDLGADDLEHVTPAFYRTSPEWEIINFTPRDAQVADLGTEDLSKLQLSVDDKADLDRGRLVADRILADERIRPSWPEVARAFMQLTSGIAGLPR